MNDLPPPTPPEPPFEPVPPTPAYTPPPPPPVEPTTLPYNAPAPGGYPEPRDGNEKSLGLVMHLIPLAGMLLSAASIPFGHVVAPLIFWLIKKGESPYLDAHGKEVLNFHINVAALSIVGFILCFICIGVPLLIALGITTLVLMVIAAMQVNEGKFYRYPWIYRVIQ